jgi:hypothetical protein
MKRMNWSKLNQRTWKNIHVGLFATVTAELIPVYNAPSTTLDAS